MFCQCPACVEYTDKKTEEVNKLPGTPPLPPMTNRLRYPIDAYQREEDKLQGQARRNWTRTININYETLRYIDILAQQRNEPWEVTAAKLLEFYVDKKLEITI